MGLENMRALKHLTLANSDQWQPSSLTCWGQLSMLTHLSVQGTTFYNEGKQQSQAHVEQKHCLQSSCKIWVVIAS